MNQSVEVFLRTVNERFNAFKADFNSLLKALVGNDPEEKKSAATRTLVSASDVQRSLSVNDQPDWLSMIVDALKQHGGRLDNAQHCEQLGVTVAICYLKIQHHKWSFTESETGFDFDALYEQFRAQSRVPELFDQLIAGLEAIVKSGDVDSRRVARTLERLVQSLRHNRDGSYFATVATWDFVVGVFRNWLWEELCKVPGIGGLLTAVRTSLDDTDAEMKKLHNDMQTEVKNQVTTEIVLLTYNRRGLPDWDMIRIADQSSE